MYPELSTWAWVTYVVSHPWERLILSQKTLTTCITSSRVGTKWNLPCLHWNSNGFSHEAGLVYASILLKFND